jgi:hypothetical protein
MATTLKYLKCSMPNCHNTVGQHSKQQNKNKQVCSQHRTSRKSEVDAWKMHKGCANKDRHYGFMCVCSSILDPATLDINHVDGHNDNRDEKNIEVLCKMCHTVVTLRNEHHLQPNPSRRAMPEDTGLFTGLLDISRFDSTVITN